ncbi:hypothetical protein [Enterococcus timonensis]|uniref:hypothetical protein n=1 Tax=Enterococcus timonensis TaxID=1852364 RepID=UPI0008DA3DD4|nr:hypothetical protein [Enterococcus timonensis]
MAAEQSKLIFHQFKRFVSRSSKQFLRNLLQDTPVARDQKMIHDRLLEAQASGRLVVLQVEQDQRNFISIAGFIGKKQILDETVVVKPLKKEDTIQLLALAKIKKVSMLERNKKPENQATGTK